jgi:hypothetical protein
MAENSGPQWCKRFPCRAFISQLKKAGAIVSIANTYRPVERA